MNWKNRRILVTGGAGFLGSYVVDILRERGAEYIEVPRSSSTDLTIRENCTRAVRNVDVVIHLAAKVGGIGLNLKKPGELFFENLLMGIQLMEEARKAGVEKFVTVATICSYPKFTPVPFAEENLWNGYPEETNAPYGLAKKMLLVQAQAYRAQYGFNSVVLFPTNLYGPRDNFDPEASHVIPALIGKVWDAQRMKKDKIVMWGDGTPTRDFLYAGDAARGIVIATERYDGNDPINLGTGVETSIEELTNLLCRLVGFDGLIEWDRSKPGGQPRRCISISRAEKELGWRPRVSLEDGLRMTVDWHRSLNRERS